MVDAFVSYSHLDAGRVEPLLAELKASGYTVWSDHDIGPGCRYEREIEQALLEASCVLIALTRHAVESDWVRAEAAVGQDCGKLIPVLLDDVPMPLSLRTLQAADLRNWCGNSAGKPDAAFKKLLRAVRSHAQRNAHPERAFVGRQGALQVLQEGYAEAQKGNGGLVMIAGEPGIGKTRCAEEFARDVEEQGGLVLWGRCYEQAGAPPYWPWVQVLREYTEASSDDELRLLLGTHGALLAAIVPELGERLNLEAQPPITLDQSGESFRLFDAVAGLFARHPTDSPLVLMLDDMHWADPSSLALLEFLAKDLRRQHLVIVCTYRDAEVTRNSPLLTTLGELTRSNRAARVRLSGLDVAETGKLAAAIAGFAMPADVVRAIFQQTDGNPLFVSEVAKVVADEHRSSSGDILAVDVPDGIREAIGRRLNRLSATCNDVLSMSSVAGREFDARVIARALSLDVDPCVDELEEAVRERIVEALDETPGMFRFAHAVIRETVYDELPTFKRPGFHRRIADTLAAIHADRPEPVLSQLVHHYVEASALGDFETAVDYALRAAAHDEKIRAFADACTHYDVALRLLTDNGAADDPRMARLHFDIGRLWKSAGQIDRAISFLSRGVELARGLGDTDLLTRSALEFVFVSSDTSQRHSVPVLREALELVPQDDTARRAILLANLAFALRSAGAAGDVQRVGSQAIELARTTAEPKVLAVALRLAMMGLRGSADTLTRRLDYGTEALQLTHTLNEPEEVAECWYFHLLDLIEAGRLRTFERLLARYEEHVSRYRLPRHEYQAKLLGIALRLMRGEWANIERRIEAALTQGGKLQREEVEGIYGAQMFMLNRDRGQLRTMRPLVQRLLADSTHRLWPPGLMLLCAEVGLLDAARETFESLAENDFANIPRDEMWMTCMIFSALTCARIEDAPRARLLYELLLPYAQQTANHPAAVCYGSVAAFLGQLAHTMGDAQLAEQHFDDGVEINRQIGAWPAVVQTQVALARLLLDSDDVSRATRARQLLADAEPLARRFSMDGLTAEIECLLSSDSANLPDGLTPREMDVLKLLAIGRSNKDISRVLAISLNTVATHVRSILAKTECANRTEAAAYAMRNELN